MIVAKKLLVLLLTSAFFSYAQGNSFTKVRYNGGSVASKVNAKDWGNKLTVTPEAIVLVLKDKQRVEIPSKSVTSLSYGQEAHRRVGTMIALAILVAPVALFGLLHKTRLHFIGIQYKTSGDNTGGILLQGDKDNYRAMIVALQGVAGVPVSVGEKERSFIPVGVSTTVVNGTDEKKSATQPPATQAASSEATGTVIVDTNPNGADIYVDDQFCGNGPATLKLKSGKHTIRVKMSGFKDWSRELASGVGNETHLTATLEKN
jgi:PEGA domain